MFCTKCGAENGDNRFCTECGEQLMSADDLETSPDFVVQSPSNTLNVFEQTGSPGNDFFSKNTINKTPVSQGNDNATTVLGDADKVKLIDNNGREFPINNLPAIIGKGSAADIIISGDETISRQHFCIHSYSGNGYVIEDLGSTNKTYLNGNLLEKEELVMLNPGDTIKTGMTTFTVKF